MKMDQSESRTGLPFVSEEHTFRFLGMLCFLGLQRSLKLSLSFYHTVCIGLVAMTLCGWAFQKFLVKLTRASLCNSQTRILTGKSPNLHMNLRECGRLYFPKMTSISLIPQASQQYNLAIPCMQRWGLCPLLNVSRLPQIECSRSGHMWLLKLSRKKPWVPAWSLEMLALAWKSAPM